MWAASDSQLKFSTPRLFFFLEVVFTLVLKLFYNFFNNSFIKMNGVT